jgi:hypothetical protein
MGTEPGRATPSCGRICQKGATSIVARSPMRSDATELAQRLVGSWFHCDASPQLNPMWPGIEFAPDGTVTVLIDDGAGGLVAGQGIDNQGRWDIRGYGSQLQHTCGSGATWYLDIYGAGAASSPVPAFETSPRRFVYDAAVSKWFVPLTRQ